MEASSEELTATVVPARATIAGGIVCGSEEAEEEDEEEEEKEEEEGGAAAEGTGREGEELLDCERDEGREGGREEGLDAVPAALPPARLMCSIAAEEPTVEASSSASTETGTPDDMFATEGAGAGALAALASKDIAFWPVCGLAANGFGTGTPAARSTMAATSSNPLARARD